MAGRNLVGEKEKGNKQTQRKQKAGSAEKPKHNRSSSDWKAQRLSSQESPQPATCFPSPVLCRKGNGKHHPPCRWGSGSYVHVQGWKRVPAPRSSKLLAYITTYWPFLLLQRCHELMTIQNCKRATSDTNTNSVNV